MLHVSLLPRLTITFQQNLRCIKRVCHLQERKHCCHKTKAVVLSGQRCSRPLSTEAVLHPSPHNEEKQYPEKIRRLVDDISRLTLIEVSDLNELLKKTLNIQEAPAMPVGMMPMYGQPAQAAEDGEEEGTAVKEKTSFTVKLTKFDDTKKVALIKEIKSVMEGMNLVQAKKFVESAPQVVKADVGKDEAEKLKAAIEAAGGTCDIE